MVRIQGRGVAGTVAAKVKHLFGLCKEFEEKMCKVSAKKQVYLFFLPSRSHFYAKSEELEVVFNRCWVFRDAKCGIYKPKLGIYTPSVMGRGTLVHSLGSMNLSPMIHCNVSSMNLA